MNTNVRDVILFLEELAPIGLAEDWDNVGLLLGDPADSVRAVMTCLTLTPDVAKEAIDRQAGMVITHHPILFRSIKRLTAETPEGAMLLELIRNGVAVYSPHTSFDNAAGGINQWLAERLELTSVTPLRPRENASSGGETAASLGAGRFGDLESPQEWPDFKRTLRQKLKLANFQAVPPEKAAVERVGIACGAAAEFLKDARRQGCELLITGEARFHACLEARSLGIGMVLLGHYASERPAMEMLAGRLAERFPDLTVWASAEETDPITWEIGDGV